MVAEVTVQALEGKVMIEVISMGFTDLTLFGPNDRIEYGRMRLSTSNNEVGNEDYYSL